MSQEKFTDTEVRTYQTLLNQREQVRRASRRSHDAQQRLPPGSKNRDNQGVETEKLWDELGKLTQQLLGAGVIDGMGRLTEKASRSGLKLT